MSLLTLLTSQIGLKTPIPHPDTNRGFRSELRKRWKEMLDEYIAEAEHQDGIGYWKQFDSIEAAIADLFLYFKILEDTDA